MSSFCVFVILALCGHCPAYSQFYTFTSGFNGDGFDWPASPTGLLNGDFFFTPDGFSFDNFTENSVFFDDNYLVASNSIDIDGDALWGNPNSGTLDVYLDELGTQSVQFGYAQSIGGAPDQTSTFLDIYVEDTDGRATVYSAFLGNSYTGLGGFDGYSDVVQLDASSLVDDFGSVDGGSFVDIAYFSLEIFDLDNTLAPAEFAIDNFSIDGSGNGGDGEVFPSVNGGQFDVSDSTTGTNSLRGTGTFGIGLEVTNGTDFDTTYSVQLVGGGGLSAGTLPSGDFIGAGQSIFNPDVATIDRSLPSGTYESDVTTINNGDPLDPDNTSTLSIDLFESESLSGNFSGVDVNAFEDVSLSNAAAPAGGFRAAVKVTGATTTGPFAVDDFTVGQRLLDDESIQANVTFRRFGQLSGAYMGTYTVGLEQAAFVVNEFVDLETFLANKEPVPDETWTLNYTLVNTGTDNANFSVGNSYAERLGVNRFEVAATLIDGTSSTNQNVSMQFQADPDPGSADLIGDPVDLTFGGGDGDLYVLQFTYDESLVPGGFAESQLQLLWFDENTETWTFAIDGNSSSTSTFFAGSWEEYLAGPGGGTFDAADLGAFGVDTENNHVWAALDHASLFAVGVLAGGDLGDFDGSGNVDGFDFLLWQRGGSPNPLSASDLAEWQANYNAALAAAKVVPEPSTALLLTLASLVAVGGRRRVSS
ncbi:MAG: PEP-CTERM sorting domain-containing protein [Planctomycetota bacterium]